MGVPSIEDKPRWVKDLIEARRRDDTALWHGLIFQILLYFLKWETSHSAQDALSASHLSPVLEFVHGHPHVSCTVEFLSKKFGVPRRELSLGFRKAMGIPLKKYLLQTQLRRAKELLSNQELSVEAIALTLGFEHPTYFYRFFKRGSGLTPNSFRKAQKS